MRRKILLLARLLLVSVLAIAWFAPGATAETAVSLHVPAPSDYYFTFDADAILQVRAFGYDAGYDTYLWLYDSQDVLIAQNDDWFGLDSWLDFPVTAGTYRLRAGVCCGDPNAWYYWYTDTGYTIEVNALPAVPQETTTTTTVVETTTTTTEIVETTTTTEPAPTTIVTEPPQQEVPAWPPVTESTLPTTTIITTAPETTAPATSAPPSTEVSTPSSPPLTQSPETVDTGVVTQAPATVPTAIPPAESVAPEQPPAVVPPQTTTTTSTVVPTTTVATYDTAPPVNAPLEVRKAFENSVDLFSGEFDDYVPVGSTITVAQRRVVIAATAVMFLLPAPTSRKRT